MRDNQFSQRTGSEPKLALVIGNSAYENAPLLNTINDARAISGVLESLGFEVILGENLTITEMKRTIDQFGRRLEASGGVGLFYYSGHGIQVDGNNYLIPTQSRIRHEGQVDYRAVRVGEVLAEMENSRNRINIVILDACRDNPFARSFRSTKSGLASIDAPVGTILAYSTAPGKTASDGTGINGRYTSELIKWMPQPGISIENMFKKVRSAVIQKSNRQQVPWESSSLVGDFYFNTAGGSTRVAAIENVPQANQALRNDTDQDVQSASIGDQASLRVNEEDTIFSEGERSYYNRNYSESRLQLSKFVDKYPNSVQAPKALYYIAESYNVQDNRSEAVKKYSELINRFPNSTEANIAKGKISDLEARLQNDKEKKDESNIIYDQGHYDKESDYINYNSMGN